MCCDLDNDVMILSFYDYTLLITTINDKSNDLIIYKKEWNHKKGGIKT